MSKDELKKAIQQAVQATPHPEKIQRVRLFGSYLHGDNRLDSDIDLIVDFFNTASMGFFEFFDVEQAFSQALGKKVDLVTAKGLKKYIRKKVLAEAETLYERA